MLKAKTMKEKDIHLFKAFFMHNDEAMVIKTTAEGDIYGKTPERAIELALSKITDIAEIEAKKEDQVSILDIKIKTKTLSDNAEVAALFNEDDTGCIIAPIGKVGYNMALSEFRLFSFDYEATNSGRDLIFSNIKIELLES